MKMLEVRNIATIEPHYKQEWELRNNVLLRPLGIPDNSWEISDENAWHFDATENNRVVACAVLAPLESKSKARLIQVAVDVTLQGKGVGKILINSILKFAKKEELKEIVCHSRASANKFYKKLGFEIYGESF